MSTHPFRPEDFNFIYRKDLNPPGYKLFERNSPGFPVSEGWDSLRINTYLSKSENFVQIWHGVIEHAFAAHWCEENLDFDAEIQDQPLFSGYINTNEEAEVILRTLRLDLFKTESHLGYDPALLKDHRRMKRKPGEGLSDEEKEAIRSLGFDLLIGNKHELWRYEHFLEKTDINKHVVNLPPKFTGPAIPIQIGPYEVVLPYHGTDNDRITIRRYYLTEQKNLMLLFFQETVEGLKEPLEFFGVCKRLGARRLFLGLMIHEMYKNDDLSQPLREKYRINYPSKGSHEQNDSEGK